MSQMSNQNKNNDLNYLIDTTFSIRSITTDYLYYLSKMKMTELLTINITCQT